MDETNVNEKENMNERFEKTEINKEENSDNNNNNNNSAAAQIPFENNVWLKLQSLTQNGQKLSFLKSQIKNILEQNKENSKDNSHDKNEMAFEENENNNNDILNPAKIKYELPSQPPVLNMFRCLFYFF